MSDKDKWVRRFSVDETHKHKNGFTIYKITSVLFPLASPEAVTVVSVWKRYSDVQNLHKSMQILHAGLHLKGTFPQLTKWSYFKRFDPEVIQERARTIKNILEFIAEHRLLFTCAEFVNFLQSGYPEPDDKQSVGPINTIRSTLQLPMEETPPLEYQSDDNESRSEGGRNQKAWSSGNRDKTNNDKDTVLNISEIEIFESTDVEIRHSPKRISPTDSFESITSLDSINSDLYEELNKITIENSKPSVKRRNILPDLINFEDRPSTSKFDDHHTMCKKNDSVTNTNGSVSETTSINSTIYDASIAPIGAESTKSMLDQPRRSNSRQSIYSKKSLTFSAGNLDCKTKTEDSYVFEAGYLLNLAATCEELGDYHRAFECYKSGIEKMLIGVQSDTDKQRRELVKEKTNKYLSYAEDIYRNHLSNNEHEQILPTVEDTSVRQALCPLPLSMLKRSYSELAQYRVLAVLASTVMLVLDRVEQKCYAMKVIQKIPNNLTEFDEYFLQRANETKTPILPTNIPYMVPLNSYMETTNLIFLILAYAPGERLFDYIKNYTKSIPNTPAREVNLENVFVDPQKLRNVNNNPDSSEGIKKLNLNNSIVEENDKIVEENHNKKSVKKESQKNNIDNLQISVDELVINSQRLLMNVDLALSDRAKIGDVVDNVKGQEVNADTRYKENKKDGNKMMLSVRPRREVISPSTICQWGAEMLVAIESLHNAGVICRDLNPNNILLGECGQIILTYCIGYEGLDMVLSVLEKQVKPGEVNMYIAPELYLITFLDPEQTENSENLDKLCDYWSFGVIMYELICGVPLSYYHRSVFTSHTILQLPDDLPIEAQSLLTQLLTYSPLERLGSGKDGIEEIKSHPYFKNIDWKSVFDRWSVPD